MKRAQELWILFAGLALVLSGCATFRVTTTIKEDGSGANQFIIAVDSSLYASSSFDDLRRQAQQAGGTVENWSEGNRRGVRVTYPFKDLDEMRQQLQGQEGGSGVFDVRVKQGGLLINRTFDADIVVDTTKFASAAGGNLGTNASALQAMDFSYAIVLPGKITSHNGELIEENQVRWRLSAGSGQAYALKASSETQNVAGLLIVGGCGAFLLFAVVVVVGGVMVMAGRSRRGARLSARQLFCSQCGIANPADSRFCLHCGAALSIGMPR
jgi:hypothetical protein